MRLFNRPNQGSLNETLRFLKNEHLYTVEKLLLAFDQVATILHSACEQSGPLSVSKCVTLEKNEMRSLLRLLRPVIRIICALNPDTESTRANGSFHLHSRFLHERDAGKLVALYRSSVKVATALVILATKANLQPHLQAQLHDQQKQKSSKTEKLSRSARPSSETPAASSAMLPASKILLDHLALLQTQLILLISAPKKAKLNVTLPAEAPTSASTPAPFTSSSIAKNSPLSGSPGFDGAPRGTKLQAVLLAVIQSDETLTDVIRLLSLTQILSSGLISTAGMLRAVFKQLFHLSEAARKRQPATDSAPAYELALLEFVGRHVRGSREANAFVTETFPKLATAPTPEVSQVAEILSRRKRFATALDLELHQVALAICAHDVPQAGVVSALAPPQPLSKDSAVKKVDFSQNVATESASVAQQWSQGESVIREPDHLAPKQDDQLEQGKSDQDEESEDIWRDINKRVINPIRNAHLILSRVNSRVFERHILGQALNRDLSGILPSALKIEEDLLTPEDPSDSESQDSLSGTSRLASRETFLAGSSGDCDSIATEGRTLHPLVNLSLSCPPLPSPAALSSSGEGTGSKSSKRRTPKLFSVKRMFRKAAAKDQEQKFALADSGTEGASTPFGTSSPFPLPQTSQLPGSYSGETGNGTVTGDIAGGIASGGIASGGMASDELSVSGGTSDCVSGRRLDMFAFPTRVDVAMHHGAVKAQQSPFMAGLRAQASARSTPEPLASFGPHTSEAGSPASSEELASVRTPLGCHCQSLSATQELLPSPKLTFFKRPKIENYTQTPNTTNIWGRVP